MDKFEKTKTTSFNNIVKRKTCISKDDLIQEVYKLKHWYNELLMIKNNNIKYLEKKREEEFSYKRLSTNTLNETASTTFKLNECNLIQSKIEELNRRKETLLKNIANDNESTTRLNFMISQERVNFDSSYEKLHDVNYKIKVLTSSKKELIVNEEAHYKKNEYSKNILNNLSQEVSRMKSLINSQEDQIIALSDEISNKKDFVTKKSEDVNENSKRMVKETKLNKENILKNINNLKLIKETNRTKELYYVKIILGLDLIKTYFIDQQETLQYNDKLLSSDDYKIFMSKNIIVYYDNQNNFPLNNNLDFSSNQSNDIPKIALSKLISKFDNLNIEFESIYNFYSKILNKQSFNHSYMIRYNDKQVNLEINRERYSKRIQELMSKYYKNFDELIKSNSKLENFMKKFGHLMKSDKNQDKIYKFNLTNKTEKDFKNKYNLLFSEINSILDFSCSKLGDICKTDELENDYYSKLKEILFKIKIHLEKINSNISSENYLQMLFDEYSNNSKFCYDQDKVDDYHETVNELNRHLLFSNLQRFFSKEKNLFNSINLNFEKSLFINLNHIHSLIEIIEGLKEISQNLNDQKCFSIKAQSESFYHKNLKKSLSKMNKKVNFEVKNEEESINSEDDFNNEVKPQQEGIIPFTNSIKKPKTRSVTKSLYEPKTNYKRDISGNFPEIKKNTINNIKGNYIFKKKECEMNKISKDMLIYNNPSNILIQRRY